MKLVIIRSKQDDSAKTIKNEYSQEFDTLYANRVIENLQGKAGFCTACESDCTFCRKSYKRKFADDIAAVIDLPAVMPYVLETPERHVPENIPPHDIMLIINIHEQVLVEIVKQCRAWHTKGIIVPLEAPDWVRGSARTSAQKICKDNGIEISFSKPFCSFDPPKHSVLAKFRETFHIGRPDVNISVENNIIKEAHVNVSAACGATYYVARWLVGKNINDDIETDVISRRIHSYPCTASMKRDPELNDDTPLHIAGQAHYDILRPFRQEQVEPDNFVQSPLGQMLPKPVPPKENMENIAHAQEIIMEELKNCSSVSLDHIRKNRTVSPAAVNSALLILKQKGKINVKGLQIFKV